MTYGFLITINLLAWLIPNPIGALNLVVAGFIAGLWAAEIVRRTCR